MCIIYNFVGFCRAFYPIRCFACVAVMICLVGEACGCGFGDKHAGYLLKSLKAWWLWGSHWKSWSTKKEGMPSKKSLKRYLWAGSHFSRDPNFGLASSPLWAVTAPSCISINLDPDSGASLPTLQPCSLARFANARARLQPSQA